MAITIQMEGIYPNLSSGRLFFENLATGTRIEFNIPKDLETNAYGIREITLDPGASSTVLPLEFAKKLDIPEPREDEAVYRVLFGVGGTSVGLKSQVPIKVGVEDGKQSLEGIIWPLCLIKHAPSITCEGRLLSEPRYQPHTQGVIPFISPPFQYRDDYTAEVRSPDGEFPKEKRRLKLEVNTGQDMDYILIGRDWQRWFDLLFKEEEIIIKGKEQ
jgi:hypothetical protein